MRTGPFAPCLQRANYPIAGPSRDVRLSVVVERTSVDAATINPVDKVMLGAARLLINNETAWTLMCNAARKEILSKSESYGLFVDTYRSSLREAGVDAAFEAIKDPNVQYPDYYLRKFHAYAEGNLNWQAAFEARYAWISISTKELKDKVPAEQITPDLAADSWVLDVGCSTGYSTRGLKANFPDMHVTGIDASPYYLAVAQTEETLRGANEEDRVHYKHAVFEKSDLPDNSADMVYFEFMFHECPTHAIRANLEKAMRVVRPGGIVAFVDIDPFSGSLAKLPAFVKAIRWSTEPWLDEYHNTDFEQLMPELGFKHVQRLQMDTRHHGYFARVPDA